MHTVVRFLALVLLLSLCNLPGAVPTDTTESPSSTSKHYSR